MHLPISNPASSVDTQPTVHQSRRSERLDGQADRDPERADRAVWADNRRNAARVSGGGMRFVSRPQRFDPCREPGVLELRRSRSPCMGDAVPQVLGGRG
jgi:hypothetical protein